MDTTNRLFVWIAYAAGAITVGVIAYAGIRYYGAPEPSSFRVSAGNAGRQPLPNTLSSLQTSSIRGAHVDHLFAQRSQIKRLQALLEQKTKLLHNTTALLERNTVEQLSLKKELDQAIALLELLAEQVSETGELTSDDNVANGELHEDLERLIQQRQQSETRAGEQDEEWNALVVELAATDEEIARLKQESEIEFRDLLDQKEAFEAVASRALATIGAESVPVLVEHLSHQRADIRQWAATVLGEIGADADEATPALIDALSDADAGVREAARQSLDLIGTAGRDDGGIVLDSQALTPGN